MEEIDLNTQLIEIDLFNLFKIQIKKDFETCGLDVNFINDLPSDFFKLKAIFINQKLWKVMRKRLTRREAASLC